MDSSGKSVEKSRMKGDLHVRFCERPELKCSRLLGNLRKNGKGEGGEKKFKNVSKWEFKILIICYI